MVPFSLPSSLRNPDPRIATSWRARASSLTMPLKRTGTWISTHKKPLRCHVINKLFSSFCIIKKKLPRKKNKVTTSSFINKLGIIGHILHQNLAWVAFTPWHHFLLNFFLNSFGAEETSPWNLSARQKPELLKGKSKWAKLTWVNQDNPHEV